ncbi:ABC transporter permease [Bdellovibrio sp. ZAP7]|uniref:ABC transporter permease n=1 Tax=Bdellovibrio sp. ZAP7 TaxID=2231053 RepID=UPI0011581CD0|nr:ABC transporter permease [Bdellovibrio sp. ZAP7]QDK44804.1 ABC transporter permease [Bdellovibrio sp. ZAP7]
MKRPSVILAISFLSILILAVLIGPFVFTQGFEQNVDQILLAPSWAHWFGTDSLGRDLFARVLLGARVSLTVGIVCAILTFLIGFTYGSIAGWFEGVLDRMMMRFCDIIMAIPSFILVAVLCLSVQVILPIADPQWAALVGLCVGISFTHWINMARVTRGMVIETKRKPFVEAAIAVGGNRPHILLRHILPNIGSTLLVLVAMQIPTNILYESFMSFIGIGVHPPYTSWGILVSEGWKTLSSFPHLILFPSLVLFLTVWSFHILIDNRKQT